jgi:sec-independent protein translocase protein TatB
MFGIGLPEMILILALALIVVGPEKLPDLARSLAKSILELKKTAEGLKKSFAEDDNPLSDIRPELEDVTKSLKVNLLDSPSSDWRQEDIPIGVNPPPQSAPATTPVDVDAEYTAVNPPEAHSPEDESDAAAAPAPKKPEPDEPAKEPVEAHHDRQ